MNVRDQDQIRLLSGAVVSVAPGVYLDDFAPELDLHASVRDRGSNSRGSEYESGEGESTTTRKAGGLMKAPRRGLHRAEGG